MSDELREKVIVGTCESVKGDKCRYPGCMKWPADKAFMRCDSRLFAADAAIRIVAEHAATVCDRLATSTRGLGGGMRQREDYKALTSGFELSAQAIRALIPKEPTDV